MMRPVFPDVRWATLPDRRSIPVKLAFPANKALLSWEADLLGIALLARTHPVGNLLDWKTVRTVTGNAAAFRRVAQENRNLLPLLLAYYLKHPHGDPLRARDSVQGLKATLREAGLSDAAWRYTVRHGSRLFRIPWKLTGGLAPFDAAIGYLNTLDLAGLPPPPPPSVAEAFLTAYNAHAGRFTLLERHCAYRIDPVVLRSGLLEADRRRRTSTVEGFVDEFLGVCWWGEGPFLLDDNQIKAGWRWFARQWRTAEASREILASRTQHSWSNRYESFHYEGLVVAPVESTAALVNEAQALRNCLVRYADECAAGAVEIYAVRDERTNKTVGCFDVRMVEGESRISDARGYANSMPKRDMRRIVEAFSARIGANLSLIDTPKTL